MICPLFIGTGEVLLVAGVVFLLFGGKKLPEVMRGFGLGIKYFKKELNEITNSFPEKENSTHN